MLKCLPEAVQEKLRSGQNITSLQQCVEELVLNSIDAEASCVGVRVDLDAFKVQVIDNGTGMKEEDMESVGNRYHTSKCSCVEDLENLRWFGFRGEALASIVSLASLVELSSRSKSSAKTQVKVFKNGHGLSLREAETTRPSAGTTVIVCNFLYNMPVRRKRMDAVLEAERIRHRVEAISLMHPLVSFTMKNDLTGAMTVQLPKARNTYHRFVQIHGLGRAQKLRDVGHTRGHFEVCGHIGTEGHYNSSLQFLYVNRRLLLKTRIHKVLNHLLRRLSSSQRHDDPGVRSPKHKNQELYGVYVINIKCPYSEYDICLEPTKTLIEFKDWDGVLLCVEEAVRAFLSRENLVSQDDVDLKSPKLFTNSPDQEGHNGGQATSSSVPTLDDIGAKLASEPVHRKRKDNQECEGETGLQEEQAMTVDEEEKLESEGGINGEFRSELLDGLEPVSDDHLTEEEDPGRQESGQLKPSEDIETPLNTTTPSLTNNKQIFTGLHALDTNRKISLLDPYVHESMLTQEVNKLPHIFERSFASKRKISLNPGSDFCPVVTSKIQRISACEKTFLCKESGSLEKFRRIYGKSDQVKFQRRAKPPQTDGFVPKSQNLKVCQDDGGDATTQNILQIPTASKPKPNSLAAKLCRLKQHGTDDSRLSNPNPNQPHLSTTSQDGSSSRSNEDTNNNNNPENPEDPENPENPEPASSLWLHHYDSSVGKTVYVNKVTGLSRYHDPPGQETQARCTSDVTNVAVAVVTETDANEESSNSLKSLYSKWNNPVFVRPPTVAVDVSSGRADGLAVKIHNILFPYRFSKAMIHTMKVIHQVDKKFLACLINTREEDPAAGAEPEGNLLVLVDQHAAHERVRLENLVADSYEDDPETPGERRLSSSTIVPPLKISVTEEEQRLLSSCQAHLQSLGLEVKFLQGAEPHLLVGKVPLCFIEKESNELRRGRPSVIKPVVEEYLREQIELLRSAGRVRGSLPLTVLKVLASLACHGAIKFNDSLSRDECCSLVASLSSCQLPFQCAHGRPSIAPLVDTRHLDQDPKESQKPNLQKLRRMYKSWKLYGNG